MINVTQELKGTILILTVDISQDHGPSKTGKSHIIATTSGIINVFHADNGAKFGLNVFK